ncbi:MAG: hypothetical protein FJ344_06775 [Sphingomonadales bacterium]|nr:hypothetical protein [Sphingomonadales bacterium]
MSISRNSLLFIDFEGLIKEDPSLVGVCSDDQFRLVILDPRLEGVLQSPLAHEIPISFLSITDFLEQTVKLVRTEHKVIVAFSEREQLVFQSKGWNVSDYYWNAHKSLKQWFNQHDRINRPKPFTLNSILRYFSYPLHTDYGEKQATQRIVHVRNMLEARQQTYSQLTNVAKSKCTKLLRYNQKDVKGLVFALEQTGLISSDIET